MYVIKNFQVKDYTDLDKFRPVQMDKQIVFTADTKVKDVEESEIFIPRNSFDFFDFGDLMPMAKQSLYLAGKYTKYIQFDFVLLLQQNVTNSTNLCKKRCHRHYSEQTKGLSCPK